MAGPNESGAPNKKELLTLGCAKSVSDATDTDAILVMLSHLPVLRSSTTNEMPLSLSEVTSFSTMSIVPPGVMSSIKPMTSSLESNCNSG